MCVCVCVCVSVLCVVIGFGVCAYVYHVCDGAGLCAAGLRGLVVFLLVQLYVLVAFLRDAGPVGVINFLRPKLATQGDVSVQQNISKPSHNAWSCPDQGKIAIARV